METQFEANADIKTGSTAVKHLHSNKSVLPKEDGVDILVLCLHQDHKNGLYLKMCGVCKLSQRDILSLQLQRFAIVLKGFFVNNTVSRFYGWPSRKGLREELWSDELDVFLNRKATKEEIRIAGIKLSAAH